MGSIKSIFPWGDGVPPPTPCCLDRKQTGGHNKHCSQKEVVGLFDANLCRCFYFPPICSHFHESEPVPQASQLCFASTLRCLWFAEPIFVM